MRVIRRLLGAAVPQRCHPHYYLRNLLGQAEGRVIGGPFAGLRYVDRAVCSALWPKLLGTYEMELHPAVHEILRLRPSLVIDIGAAEGYYACGIASKLPGASVIAYEADLAGRYLLHRTIALNGLENQIVVRGFCDACAIKADLARNPRGAVIISDAEGFEYEILDPQATPALREVHLLVEVHDFILSGLTAVLTERFTDSHIIETIPASARTRRDFPLHGSDLYVRYAPWKYVHFFLDEGRPEDMVWLWMKPRRRDVDRGGP